MNRQAKRMMARQQRAAPQDRAEAARQRRAALGGGERRERTSMSSFLKEVRAELRKVAWPSRRELIGYTVVVLVSVVVLTALVFALDLGFSKSILRLMTGG